MNKWTAIRQDSVRLQILINLMQSLWKQGCASALDEKLAGERTCRHLAGPSAKEEVRRRVSQGGIKGVCWRNTWDVREVLKSNLRSLRSGLKETWKEMVLWERKWTTGLPTETVRDVRKDAQSKLDRYRVKKIKEAQEKEK